MSEDEVMELAQRAGTYTEVEDGEEWLVMSESAFPRFAALIEQHLSYDGIHTCHAECQRPACVAVREAVKAERERCILILEHLHERSGGQYNYYLHAAKVLKGEI